MCRARHRLAAEGAVGDVGAAAARSAPRAATLPSAASGTRARRGSEAAARRRCRSPRGRRRPHSACAPAAAARANRRAGAAGGGGSAARRRRPPRAAATATATTRGANLCARPRRAATTGGGGPPGAPTATSLGRGGARGRSVPSPAPRARVKPRASRIYNTAIKTPTGESIRNPVRVLMAQEITKSFQKTGGHVIQPAGIDRRVLELLLPLFSHKNPKFC